MFGPENIMWVKNVKRNDGLEWAYHDKSCGETFLLNWPSAWPGTANTPQVGDIILLFQKPNVINGVTNHSVHLTHLVSPISNKVYEDNLHSEHRWCREVQLIAIAAPINAIPNPGYLNFFKPNRGQTHPIGNLENTINLSMQQLKERIWNLFEGSFCLDIPIDPMALIPFEVFGEREGDTIVREHIRQELTRRSSRVVQLAKSNAIRKGNGRILCECCAFDFLAIYGIIGEAFIECHHRIHLAEGERITNPEDLALVCSNCHRMLHRKTEDGIYHTVESLREIINQQKG